MNTRFEQEKATLRDLSVGGRDALRNNSCAFAVLSPFDFKFVDVFF
jgi:hypothetical protein